MSTERERILQLFGDLDPALLREILDCRAEHAELKQVADWLEMDGGHSADNFPLSPIALKVRAILLRDALNPST